MKTYSKVHETEARIFMGLILSQIKMQEIWTFLNDILLLLFLLLFYITSFVQFLLQVTHF